MKTQSVATCVAILCAFAWIGLDGDATTPTMFAEETAPADGSCCAFPVTDGCGRPPTHTIRMSISKRIFYKQF
jgi:hypothetical protein